MNNIKNNKPVIIGLHGKIGSGKDTFFSLMNSFIPDLKRTAFADKLKEVVAILTNIDVKLLHTQDGKNILNPLFNMTYGVMLQQIGTNHLRNFDDNIWIKSTYSNMLDNTNYVITDLRFKNEARYIKDNGGFLFKIEGDPVKIRANSNRDLNHQSEIDLDDWTEWDEIIQNDSDLDSLKIKAELISFKYLKTI